ncbi:bacteriophage antitermination protein Q [Cronobacter dublinensis]|uniref:bacteriophage antitermination protein Q n=1 Tax=Cronobacter dublinensis TaxID=413497 RepID=UPI0024AEAE8C|nr:bacteriophage antitermination protein Q [Cronobacter dublinensis]MDI7390294.1 bacteriophage antitermination protein Q [Cronobacter dublinensis]
MNLLKDGIRLHKSNFASIGQQLQPLLATGDCYRLIIRPWRETRSLSQNALAHMWFAEISDYLIKRGKSFASPAWVPVEYATASWRRAVLALDEVESAWLLWCYSENMRYAHQVEIVRWGWETFSEELKGQRIAGKILERLRALVWLAAQDVKRELRNEPQGCYKAQELAQMVGVTKSTWSEGYAARWAQMRANFLYLDKSAVMDAAKTRSMQKVANYKQVIANPN